MGLRNNRIKHRLETISNRLADDLINHIAKAYGSKIRKPFKIMDFRDQSNKCMVYRPKDRP